MRYLKKLYASNLSIIDSLNKRDSETQAQRRMQLISDNEIISKLLYES